MGVKRVRNRTKALIGPVNHCTKNATSLGVQAADQIRMFATYRDILGICPREQFLGFGKIFEVDLDWTLERLGGPQKLLGLSRGADGVHDRFDITFLRGKPVPLGSHSLM